MISAKIRQLILKTLKPSLKDGEKCFIFGSALDTENFEDIDIAVQNLKNSEVLYHAKEALENSHIPYKIDLVDFDRADPTFQKKILNQNIQWLT